MEEYMNEVYDYVCKKGGKVNIGNHKLKRPSGPLGKMKMKEIFKQYGKSHFTVEIKGSGDSSKCFISAIPDIDRANGSTSLPGDESNPTPEAYVIKVYNYVREKGGKMDLSDIGNNSGLQRPYFPERKKKVKEILEEYGKSHFTLETVGSGASAKCFASVIPNQDSADERASTSGEVFEIAPIGKTFPLKDKTKCYYITDPANMQDAAERVFADIEGIGTTPTRFVSIKCEGFPGGLELLQVATGRSVYVFDCGQLGAKQVCTVLERLLRSESPIKLIHDLHFEAVALKTFGGIELVNVLDTQLVAEFLWNKPFTRFNALLAELELPTHPCHDFVTGRIKGGVDLWSKRPIAKQNLEYAAMNATFLLNAADTIQGLLTSSALQQLLEASSSRVQNSIRHNCSRAICFDKYRNFAVASPELMRATDAIDNRVFYGEKLEVKSDLSEIFDVLPSIYKTKLVIPTHEGHVNIMDYFKKGRTKNKEATATATATTTNVATIPHERLSDLVFDVGRRALCWVGDVRVFLCDDPHKMVTPEEIEEITAKLGTFGSDNRAGLDVRSFEKQGSLHRFSAMRNREGTIAGLTIRVGRTVSGNAAMLADLLANTDRSILILGEPGSGKTTIVREATRILARKKNVVVVDTSNEIAGDGVSPNSCIGLARRMMVPSLDKQSQVMIECVQNHTPHVMVIDEIGRSREVQAANTVKQRGVRMIASAHGDLRKLLKNKDLNGLVGGLETTTLGDDFAREEAKRKKNLVRQQTGEERTFDVISKNQTTRKSDPTFEIVVEVGRQSRHEWRIVTNSAKAVDKILDGLLYHAQLRKRDPETGEMFMEFVDA